MSDDGYLWGWGGELYFYNPYEPDVVPLLSPTKIGQANNWKKVEAGSTSVFLLKKDGSLWAWGQSTVGQFQSVGLAFTNEPVQIGDDNDWLDVKIVSNHKLYPSIEETIIALKSDGSLWTWGSNRGGLLGVGRESSNKALKQIDFDKNWKKLSADLSFGLKVDGSLWGWGINHNSLGYINRIHLHGKVGDNTTINRSRPSRVSITQPVRDFYSTGLGGYAITTDGKLFFWGAGYNGGGSDSLTISSVPIQVGTDSDWAVIRGNWQQAFAIKANGRLYAWGQYAGTGLRPSQNDPPIIIEPRRISDGADWVDIKRSSVFYMALKVDGSIWTWGTGYHGDGNDYASYVDRTPLDIGITWKQLPNLLNSNRIGLIDTNSSLWIWGSDLLGLSNVDKSFVPIKVEGNWSQVEISGGISCGIRSDGSLWAWGGGSNLFDDDTVDISKPRLVDSSMRWIQILPWQHSVQNFGTQSGCVGIVEDGTLWAWGDYPNIDGHKWDNIPSRVTIGDIGTSIHDSEPTLATNISLNDNYPNPFNPETLISFDIPQAARVRVTVYNLLGMPIITLVDRVLNSGTHSVKFDGSNLSSGVYFYRLEVNGQSYVKKMTLLK